MKKLFALFALVLVCFGQAKAQFEFTLYGGGSINKIQFKEFETFVLNYNAANATDITEPMKFRSWGIGYDMGLTCSVGRYFCSVGGGGNKTRETVAITKFAERHIYFRTWDLDIKVGGSFGKNKGITPYICMTTMAMQIRSYSEYNGVKSYGSDRLLNGVFTSWKLNTCLGLRLTKGRYYVDFAFPLNAKSYGGGSFDETTNSTEDYSFPINPAQIGSTSPVLLTPITETYRNIRLCFGISIPFTRDLED
ncbi:MAG: hypothetical protein ACRCYO_11380 [Bacteroidia bacterium]